MTSSLPCGQTSLLLQMTERLALSDAHFRRISQLIYQRAGIVLADHKLLNSVVDCVRLARAVVINVLMSSAG